jgi:hypothetical protein
MIPAILLPYLVGVVLSLGVAVFARYSGFDRDRAFYATVVVVVASYYVLFAVIGGSVHALLAESTVMTAFVAAAVLGFRSSTWIIVAALAGHGVLDGFHGLVIDNAGMPAYWPAFCASYDIGAAAWLAWLHARRSSR